MVMPWWPSGVHTHTHTLSCSCYQCVWSMMITLIWSDTYERSEHSECVISVFLQLMQLCCLNDRLEQQNRLLNVNITSCVKTSPEHLQEVSFSTAADLKKRSKKWKSTLWTTEESLNGFKENRRNKSCLCAIFVSADKSQSGYSYAK